MASIGMILNMFLFEIEIMGSTVLYVYSRSSRSSVIHRRSQFSMSLPTQQCGWNVDKTIHPCLAMKVHSMIINTKMCSHKNRKQKKKKRKKKFQNRNWIQLRNEKALMQNYRSRRLVQPSSFQNSRKPEIDKLKLIRRTFCRSSKKFFTFFFFLLLFNQQKKRRAWVKNLSLSLSLSWKRVEWSWKVMNKTSQSVRLFNDWLMKCPRTTESRQAIKAN